MNCLHKLLIIAYICTRSCVTVNNHKNNSFLNLLSSDTSFLTSPDAESPENEPETRGKASQKTTIEKIKGLFKTEDKVSTKRQNNALAMEFEDYKNVRNKKEVDVNHLQVQKSNSMFTNNTDKGVIHFTSDLGKLSGKGSITRATLKLTKLFDAKVVGLACKSNSVNVFLIEPPTEDLKLKTIKGPIKLEFKKDEMELDVSKFFDDLDNESESGAPPNLSGASSLLQFNDLSNKNDDDLGFDDDSANSEKKGPEESDDDFFNNNKEGSESDSDSTAPKGAFDKYLMLEADDGCYFAFDVDNKKPSLKIELSKKIVTKTKGKYKTASLGAIGVFALVLVGVIGYLIKHSKGENSIMMADSPNGGMMAGY